MSRDVEVPVGVSDNAAAQGGHLPECPIGQHPTRFDSCICDRLRACEARVFADRTDHWNAGLDAATEAVAANRLTGLVTEGWEHTINETIDEALAAIAALKGEQT